MRKIYFLPLIMMLISCEKEIIEPTPVIENGIKMDVKYDTVNLSTTGQTIDVINDYGHHVSPMVYYENENQEYILLSSNGNLSKSYPTVQLKKINKSWVYSKSFNDCKMGVGRNFELTKDGIVYSDHGYEGEPRPFGDLFYGKFNNDDIKWVKIGVGNGKSFYHDVSTGDLNNDGLIDVVGIHMGIKNHDWGDVFHTFIQTNDGHFIENRNLVNHNIGNYNHYNSNGAIQVQDLNNDNKPEIIKATYGKISTEKRYSFLIYSFNKLTNQYEVVSEPSLLGIYQNPNIGTTSIQTNDFDGDGDIDIALSFEGDYNGIQIYENKGNFNFIPKDLLKFTPQEMEFREFNLIDFDGDNDYDIILNPFHYGSKFRSEDRKDIYLNNLIWKNDKTHFSTINDKIEIRNVSPDFLKGYMVNGVFKFIGTNSTIGNYSIGVYEINLKFNE